VRHNINDLEIIWLSLYRT